MNFARFLAALTGLAAVLLPRVHAEDNAWPVRVAQTDDAGNVTSWEAAGPLFFQKPAANAGTVAGFRPFFAQWKTAGGEVAETNVLYPLFAYRTDGETYRWSVLQLINRSGDRAERKAELLPALSYDTFDVWPFWFSRDTRDPTTSYRALFPIHGEILNRLGYDRIRFTLF
ncbi:MAG TPA: hypothetical protein VEA63_16040, partial [Opitutus sp.]|nr:hypothetical protein [Opitutus sp.]